MPNFFFCILYFRFILVKFLIQLPSLENLSNAKTKIKTNFFNILNFYKINSEIFDLIDIISIKDNLFVNHSKHGYSLF